MKKILAMILALLMALTFIAPAFSDDIEIIMSDPIDEQIEVLEEFELSLDLE